MPAEPAATRPRRSCLTVPASSQRMLEKAPGAGADELVFDLEDAVAAGEKDEARKLLAAALGDAAPGGPRLTVRVNAPRSRWCHRDVEVLAGIPALASIVVPKVESAADVAFCERLLDGVEAEAGRAEPVGLQLLVESAPGLERAAEIASASARVEALILGYADLAASLGRPRRGDLESWRFAQERVVVAARTGGVAAIDGPHFELGEESGLEAAAALTAGLGFDGKWAIHPAQIAPINAAFTPSPEQLDRARAVLDALGAAEQAGKGAARLDGEMVDEAMAVAARRLLARAGGAG
jgi:citrate lyase subunit beta / citryl-CoA lyase